MPRTNERSGTKESGRLRTVWHIVHNCECRHAPTWREAVDELDALVAERDALREALEEAADWLDNDLAHAPDTPISMADRELIAHWRSVLDRTCPE